MKYNVLPKCPPKCPPSPPKMSSQMSSQTEMGGQILPFGRTLVTLLHKSTDIAMFNKTAV